MQPACSHKELLGRVFPPDITEHLCASGGMVATAHDEVTILFCDICSFTELAARLPTKAVVELLHDLFSRFDGLCDGHSITKVETVGDAYMAVCGHDGATGAHAALMMAMAADMLEQVQQLAALLPFPLQVRVGMHTGPAHSGVIGIKRPRWCFFGDTVNTASRMESHGFPGCVLVSGTTHDRLLGGSWDFSPVLRHVKGKGLMTTWLAHVGAYEAALSSCDRVPRALTAADDAAAPPPLPPRGGGGVATTPTATDGAAAGALERCTSCDVPGTPTSRDLATSDAFLSTSAPPLSGPSAEQPVGAAQHCFRPFPNDRLRALRAFAPASSTSRDTTQLQASPVAHGFIPLRGEADMASPEAPPRGARSPAKREAASGQQVSWLRSSLDVREHVRDTAGGPSSQPVPPAVPSCADLRRQHSPAIEWRAEDLLAASPAPEAVAPAPWWGFTLRLVGK